MQGPTGLGDFLSRQPAISQRQIDPATGFPVQTSSGKGGSKGGARTFNPESQAVVDEYNRNPDPTLGKSLSPTGSVQQYTGSPPPMMDAGRYQRGGGGGTVYRSPADQRLNEEMALREQQSSDRPMMVENPMFFGNNPPPRFTQGLPERPMFQTQGPESLMGEITQSPRYQAIQIPPPPTPLTVQQRTGFSGAMEQAGGRPNIRPAMNVGKATGGPVGLASLIGMSNGGPTVQEGDGYRGAFNVQRMPPQTEKEARAIFDYDLEMDALNSAQEYLLNRFGRASLPEGRAPRNPATYQVDGIEELIMSSKGMR